MRPYGGSLSNLVLRGAMDTSVLLRTLPEGMVPRYVIRAPNKPMVIFRGRFRLRRKTKTWALQGTVRLLWWPHPTVDFQGTVLRGGMVSLLQRAQIFIPAGRGTGDTSVTSTSWGPQETARGSVRGPLTFGRRRAVRAVRLHLVNFHEYVGEPVRYSRGDSSRFARSRLTLRHADWIVRIDQDPEFRRTRDLLRVYGGYGVGHVGTLERTDGARFQVSETAQLFACLSYFLSFARGLWCAPIVVEGLGAARSPIWTEWRSGALITDWRTPSSWFPLLDTDEISSAFDGFCGLWERPSWNQALRESIYWFLDANLNAGAIEGSLILAHATLERLTWTYIVGELGLFTPKNFDGLGSEKRIEALLTQLKIPRAVPRSLRALVAWGRRQGVRHGPGVIARLRNKLVHPTPSGRQAVAEASRKTRFQARQLALWYIELVILALCGYKGNCVARVVKPGSSIGMATRRVPWIRSR
jgi:hypothetical protein